MNMRIWLRDRWQSDLITIVTNELAKRDYADERYDPADDEETYEQFLRLLFPPDWRDNPKTSPQFF